MHFTLMTSVFSVNTTHMLGDKWFNTELVERTWGVVTAHGLGSTILAFCWALATHATPLHTLTLSMSSVLSAVKPKFSVACGVISMKLHSLVDNRCAYTDMYVLHT